LWTSALAEGESHLEPVVSSDDARAMLHCVGELGASVTGGGLGSGWLGLRGFGASPRMPALLNPDNAGAVLRFLIGVSAIAGPVHFKTSRMDSLGKRPNGDLLDALQRWGVEFSQRNEAGTLPIVASGPIGAFSPEVAVSGEISSQFLSSLLMIAPAVAKKRGRPVAIVVTGDLKSRPAVETTLDVLRARGIAVEVDGRFSRFEIQPGDFRPGPCRVNGDWPGAAAILCAAAAVPGSQVRIEGLARDAQGERHIVEVLRQMGCSIKQDENAVELRAPVRLRAIERLDGDLMTDAIPPLMAVCAVAEGTSRVENVENLRHKECNRIDDPLGELRKLGVVSRSGQSWFEIDGRPDGFEGGTVLNGHKDHRVIFLLCIAGLRSRCPVTVSTASHIAKSFPGFFDDMRRLGASIASA